MKEDDEVLIEGRITVLQRSLGPRYAGGWVVEPPVKGLRYWNEQEMIPVKPEEAKP